MPRNYERPDRDNSGEGNRNSERRSFGKPSGDREGKKIFNRRDKADRTDNREGGERRSFGANRREGGERKPYGDRREGGERRNYGNDRREGGERRSFGGDRREGGEGRNFGGDRREGGRFGSGNRREESGERRSYGNDRREGGERRSFSSDRREGGERRSFNSDRPDRREDGERRSFNSNRREGGERKPYNAGARGEREGRSFGGNREGGERRPYNSDRPKRYEGSRDGERRPYGADRGERSERRPYNPDFKRDDKRESRGFNREERDQKPADGEKRTFGTGKAFERNPRLGRNADERKSRYSNREDKPETPEYNLSRYKDNPRIKKTNRKEEDEDGMIRLNRYIANAGVCSRREADTLIEAGEIKVNGEVITEMGYKVKPSDTVQYGKKVLSREKMVYVLLNKPKDFITTTDDPEGRKTVMELVDKASSERIFPVGRLDRNTTGLLLFTNDGEVAQKLTHPSNNIRKIYQVELDKPITKEDFKKIAEGLELEDGKAEVDDLAIIGDSNRFLGIEIHIGRNRIVRRIFEHLGYDVVSLDRVQYAGLTKKDLPRGNWRYLSEKEVIRLKYFM